MAIMRLGEYTKGTSRISSPWPVLKVKAPLSATKLSLMFPLASFLCCCSLAMEILKEENHLNAILLVNFIFVDDIVHLLSILNLFQGILRFAFMARA